MNREEIIRMAREADLGFLLNENWLMHEELERFAALVIANHPPQSYMTWQEGYEAGKQTEREACAQFIEHEYVRQFERPWRVDLSAAIRARGQA